MARSRSGRGSGSTCPLLPPSVTATITTPTAIMTKTTTGLASSSVGGPYSPLRPPPAQPPRIHLNANSDIPQ